MPFAEKIGGYGPLQNQWGLCLIQGLNNFGNSGGNSNSIIVSISRLVPLDSVHQANPLG
jgi:hypothetical protein